MRASVPALLLTVALAAAGCGGSSYGNKSGGSSTSGSGSSSSTSSGGGYGGGTSAKTKSSSAAPAGGTIDVALQNIAFNPSAIKAKVGQTIRWTNKDSVSHNVTATKGETFKSKTLNQGDTYSYKLDKAGTITYVCTFHPNMQATVTVTK